MRQPTQKEIEVAKALFDYEGGNRIPHDSGRCDVDDYINLARAAIRAMLNPDHDMTVAVVEPGKDRTWAVEVFNAMISAASPQEDEK